MKYRFISAVFAALFLPLAAAQGAENRKIDKFFGETHLHTRCLRQLYFWQSQYAR